MKKLLIAALAVGSFTALSLPANAGNGDAIISGVIRGIFQGVMSQPQRTTQRAPAQHQGRPASQHRSGSNVAAKATPTPAAAATTVTTTTTTATAVTVATPAPAPVSVVTVASPTPLPVSISGKRAHSETE